MAADRTIGAPQHTFRRTAARTPAYAWIVAALVSIVLAAPSESSAIPISPQCFVNGGGWLDDQPGQSDPMESDSFGGEAHSRRDGSIDGRWTHSMRDGGTFKGDVDKLVCRRNGGDPGHPEVPFSHAHFTGSGTLDGEPGYSFYLDVADHGEPGDDDRYHIHISETETEEPVYVIGGIIDGGNLQIHPTNPGHP